LAGSVKLMSVVSAVVFETVTAVVLVFSYLYAGLPSPSRVQPLPAPLQRKSCCPAVASVLMSRSLLALQLAGAEAESTALAGAVEEAPLRSTVPVDVRPPLKVPAVTVPGKEVEAAPLEPECVKVSVDVGFEPEPRTFCTVQSSLMAAAPFQAEARSLFVGEEKFPPLVAVEVVLSIVLPLESRVPLSTPAPL
jgi:hypothetical protein